MTKRNALINLTLVFGIWFCLAFSCKSGTRKSTSTGGTTQPSTATGGGGAPDAQVVKGTITKHWNDYAESYGDRTETVTFDSGVQLRPLTHKQYNTRVEYDAYPVRVDYTIVEKSSSGTRTTHCTGGIYFFYKNEFGEWTYDMDPLPKEVTE